MASSDGTPQLRSAIPESDPSPVVDLVRTEGDPAATKVDLTKVDARPVDLRKRVNLRKPLSDVVPRPSPAHLRTRLTGLHRLPFGSMVAVTGRAARGTRTWARGSAGRFVLPGVLMLLLVALTLTAGVVLPKALDTAPVAEARSPDDEASAEPGTDLTPPGKGDDAEVPVVPVLPSNAAGTGSGTGTNQASGALIAWAAPMAVKTSIPAQALQAYAAAELTVATEMPACGLRWTTLAGIGYVESNHGRAGNSTLTNDGRSVPPIIGLPLDGAGGRQSIRDTDGGELDGDRVWDRAVGSMQFIPDTWVRYAADGDGDGVADPNDINDAALAAARYLCTGGKVLTTVDGWWNAILSYNEVAAYAQSVYNAANDYGTKSRA